MDISKLISTLFRQFDIEIAYPDKPLKEHAVDVQYIRFIEQSC